MVRILNQEINPSTLCKNSILTKELLGDLDAERISSKLAALN